MEVHNKKHQQTAWSMLNNGYSKANKIYKEQEVISVNRWMEKEKEWEKEWRQKMGGLKIVESWGVGQKREKDKVG